MVQVPQVDESFLAIEAVNLLIKYNETMCEVPEDLQSILADSALHNASADMSTKDILARYGHIVQGHVQSQKPDAAAGAPSHSASSSQNANGMAMRVDIDANQTTALKKQSSARHVQNQNVSAPPNEYQGPRQPYAQDRTGSPASHDGYENVRSSYQAKTGVPGLAS